MDIRFADGSREEYRDEVLASGGEGDVYLSNDGERVVKLYHPHRQDKNRERQIAEIIDKYSAVGSGDYWSDLFTWPLKIVTAPRFGVCARYVPMMRMDHYLYQRSYEALPADKKGSWLGRVAVAIKVARAVERLAGRGICHSDLCPRNLMVDPVAGHATLLDCDGLVVPSMPRAWIIGSKEYMAPELVAGTSHAPSILTDQHSLAVLLYRWLLYKHPLLGTKRHSADVERDDQLALGERALYIEHPYDHSNRPPNLQLTANTLTPRLRDMFLRAFTEGLRDPTKRPAAVEWEDALVELFDRVVPCANPDCEQHFFAAPEEGALRCPLCRTSITQPAQIPYIRLEGPKPTNALKQQEPSDHYARYLLGWPGRPLYRWHANPGARPTPDEDGTTPDVSRRAYIGLDTTGRIWELHNVSFPELRAAQPQDDQRWSPIPIGTAVRLQHGTRVLLGEQSRACMAVVEMHAAR